MRKMFSWLKNLMLFLAAFATVYSVVKADPELRDAVTTVFSAESIVSVWPVLMGLTMITANIIFFFVGFRGALTSWVNASKTGIVGLAVFLIFLFTLIAFSDVDLAEVPFRGLLFLYLIGGFVMLFFSLVVEVLEAWQEEENGREAKLEEEEKE